MTLPIPPHNASQPIPNGPFNYEETYYVQSPQGHLPVGEGLEVDPETGEISAVWRSVATRGKTTKIQP